ncbi:MAG: hypothetical protein H6Q90_51 [Deltaproteobacteria bacterium]|nr:hypothetical protein [Deltaproteobacteria bacterium]
MLAKMRSLAPVLVLVVACASRPPSPMPGTIADEDGAVAAFQTTWASDVRPTIADPLVRGIDDRMQSVDALGLYHAEPHGCREGLGRVRSLGGGSFIVHGTPDALLEHDRCWSVVFLGGMKHDAEGWLDASGHLLIVWRIPEG